MWIREEKIKNIKELWDDVDGADPNSQVWPTKMVRVRELMWFDYGTKLLYGTLTNLFLLTWYTIVFNMWHVLNHHKFYERFILNPYMTKKNYNKRKTLHIPLNLKSNLKSEQSKKVNVDFDVVKQRKKNQNHIETNPWWYESIKLTLHDDHQFHLP